MKAHSLSISLWPSVMQSDAPLIYCGNHYTRNMFNYKVHWNRDFRGQILPGIYDYLTPRLPSKLNCKRNMVKKLWMTFRISHFQKYCQYNAFRCFPETRKWYQVPYKLTGLEYNLQTNRHRHDMIKLSHWWVVRSSPFSRKTCLHAT